MTFVMRGLMAWRLGFTRAVGKGSRAQVDGFIFLMMSSTSCCEMTKKQLRGWEIPGCGSAVGTGSVEKLDSRERMVSTFFLKKVMKLLHLSSVTSE